MSETSAERHKLYWLPNALTVSRILLIPVLVWGIIYPYSARFQTELANSPVLQWGLLILFALCMITDFLDGYWARKWGLVSPFGRMLDPIADKLLVASCLIAMCIVSFGWVLMVIPALIIISRDIFVSGIREHAANSSIILSPTKLAKWKTMFEMLAILFFLLALTVPAYTDLTAPSTWGNKVLLDSSASLPHSIIRLFSLALLWLAAILSAYTGFHYFRSAMSGKPTS